MKFDANKQYLIYSPNNFGLGDRDYTVISGNDIELWLKDGSLKAGDTITELTSKKWGVSQIKIIERKN